MVELTYPNLSGCKMSIANASGMSKPPVRLPDGCKEAGEMKLPPVYDFELEKAVLTKKKQREDALSGKSNTRESLQRSSITKMKSVTGADETLCVAMLEENGYDLKQSIEAFFSKN